MDEPGKSTDAKEAAAATSLWRVDARSLAIVWLIAFGLRALYVWRAWPNPAVQLPLIDAEAYRARAMQILAGEWVGDTVYYLDPLYPFFLAAIYSVVPPELIGVLLTQAALDSCSVLVIVPDMGQFRLDSSRLTECLSSDVAENAAYFSYSPDDEDMCSCRLLVSEVLQSWSEFSSP